jgi:hypothetical protein
VNEQALNEVLTEYVVENANLKIIIKQLQLEIEELKKDKEGDD